MTKEQAQDYIKLKYKMITGKSCDGLSNEVILAYLDGYDQGQIEQYVTDRDKACTAIVRFIENDLTGFNIAEMKEALLKALSDMYKMADIEDIVKKARRDAGSCMVKEVTMVKGVNNEYHKRNNVSSDKRTD